MSDYHILNGLPDGNQYQIVFHLPVPDTTNDVGVNYRVALIQYLGGDQPSQVPFITSGEQTQLDAGELYEHSWEYHTNPSENLIAKRDYLDGRFTAFSSSVVTQLQTRLGYWGYNRDVP